MSYFPLARVYPQRALIKSVSRLAQAIYLIKSHLSENRQELSSVTTSSRTDEDRLLGIFRNIIDLFDSDISLRFVVMRTPLFFIRQTNYPANRYTSKASWSEMVPHQNLKEIWTQIA